MVRFIEHSSISNCYAQLPTREKPARQLAGQRKGGPSPQPSTMWPMYTKRAVIYTQQKDYMASLDQHFLDTGTSWLLLRLQLADQGTHHMLHSCSPERKYRARYLPQQCFNSRTVSVFTQPEHQLLFNATHTHYS